MTALATALALAHTPGQAQEANPAPASSPSSSPATPAPARSESATPPGKPPAVCFKLTMHCVPANKSGAAAKAAQSSGKPLNLNAPDIRSVVSAEELKEPLPTAEQEAQTEETQTVQVKGGPRAPDVPGGFGALWWALNHPSQAWRILTPVE